MTTPLPYQPFAPGQGMRMFYTSVCEVYRNNPTLDDGGGMTLGWDLVPAVVDHYLNTPGLLQCRLDLLFVRPGKDQPQPLVAGRAPDRTGVCYFDLAADADGSSLVKAGDRLKCVSGPVFGTFEVRLVPDVAQGMLAGHHCETQVIECSQMLKTGSPMPFPGSQQP